MQVRLKSLTYTLIHKWVLDDYRQHRCLRDGFDRLGQRVRTYEAPGAVIAGFVIGRRVRKRALPIRPSLRKAVVDRRISGVERHPLANVERIAEVAGIAPAPHVLRLSLIFARTPSEQDRCRADNKSSTHRFSLDSKLFVRAICSTMNSSVIRAMHNTTAKAAHRGQIEQ